MKRRSFLALAVSSLGLVLWPRRADADCWLTPEETAGPFWFDPHLERRDIREARPGVPLVLKLALVDTACKPIEGARIDVWNRPNSKGWTPLKITEGVQRGMNIVSSPVTAAAIREVMASKSATLQQ